jgi:hypothetical protein
MKENQMALSKEEKAQLQALMDKDKEPDGPPANVNFTLDLGDDKGWERGKKLGLFRDPDDNKPEDDDDEELDDVPRRRGFMEKK